MTFDAEREELFTFALNNENFTFADDYLIADVNGSGELYLRDFDGTNKRRLAFSAAPAYGATISRNNKWLYYVSSNVNGTLELMREEI